MPEMTDSQDEQQFADLIRGYDQLVVPLFQREYAWGKTERDSLFEDIRKIEEGEEELQFLGALVTYEEPRDHNIKGVHRTLALVDGQQRVLTLYLVIMAAVELLAAHDKSAAAQHATDYLLLQPRRGLKVNTRVIPAGKNLTEFRALWDGINKPGVLASELESNPPMPPPASGDETALTRQYKGTRSLLKQRAGDRTDPPDVYYDRIITIVTSQLSFVHLKLHDAGAAPQIFERLNDRGRKVSIVDLVRNEVFARSSSVAAAEHLFNGAWDDLLTQLGARANDFFFPYALIQNSNTKKSELFGQLRSTWNGLSSEQIVQGLKPFVDAFVAIDSNPSGISELAVRERLETLISYGHPSSVYPLLIEIVTRVTDGTLDPGVAVELLAAVESFLVRRAIMQLEPTGLHALFKSMWSDLKEKPTREEFRRLVQVRPTIQWPTDQEVQGAVRTRPLAASGVMPFLLKEFDRDLPGDVPSGKPTIEHILPQAKGKPGWESFKDVHDKVVDTWANLIPLSQPLNASIQAKPYPDKSQRYMLESMWATPRRVASEYNEWKPETLEARSNELAKWVVKRWPG